MKKRSNPFFPLSLIRVLGIFTIYIGVKELVTVHSGAVLLSLIVTALFYLLFSPWVVKLPSGTSWRPGMAFILFSILNFDYRLVIFVAIPGTIFTSWGKKEFFSRFFLTMGQLSVGIYAAGLVNHLIGVPFTESLLSYLAVTICLFAHFCGNRLAAALIVAVKKNRSLMKQIYLIKNDLNWGYSGAYVLGIQMFLIFRVYGFPGILLVIFLLFTIFQSFTYFQKLKDMEEKIYLDGLTDAENRMSWEEYLKNNHHVHKPGILFMMDLDHFKMINDTYGHDYGDRILQEFVGHVKMGMKRNFRLFRYGGDEFVLLVFSENQDQSELVSEISDMLSGLNEIWRQKQLDVAVSFGYADISRHDFLEDVIRKADRFMYRNKFDKNMATIGE